MNKIEIVNDNINIINLNNDITYIIDENSLVKTLKLKILKDTSLFINYNFDNLTKLEVIFELNEFTNLKLYEIKTGVESKIRTKYLLEKESNLNVLKFNDVDTINENVVVNLNGKNSKINYIFKTISTSKEKYDLTIYHNYSNTESYIKNNGVAIKDGKIKFNVSSFVEKGNKECNVNQVNRIINLTDNKCEIYPNLYIDEYDVNAAHSALIGKFSDTEMFYLQSRGINEKDALMLLIKGFILSDIDLEDIKEMISKKIQEYWR